MTHSRLAANAPHLRRSICTRSECDDHRDVILCARRPQAARGSNEAAGVHSGYCGVARFATAFAGRRGHVVGSVSSAALLDRARPQTRGTDGLREKGWIEGKNLIIEYRYAAIPDRLPALAAELVALNPDLLIAPGPQAAVALKSATATIPIVFVAVSDPVGLGLVQSLSRPGGNITGLATFVPEISSQNE